MAGTVPSILVVVLGLVAGLKVIGAVSTPELHSFSNYSNNNYEKETRVKGGFTGSQSGEQDIQTPELQETTPDPGNVNGNDGIPKWVDSWAPPPEFVKWFPYYLSGYDYDGAPVYVLELGNMKPQEAIRKTPGGREKAKEIAAKYFEQGIFLIVRDGQANNTQGVALIVDYDGFNLLNYADPTTIEILLKINSYLNLIYNVLNYAFEINVNYAADNFMRLSKPFIGNIRDKCETYGPQKSHWLPQLLRKIPPSQLPPWYGGDETWRPVRIGGRSGSPSNMTEMH